MPTADQLLAQSKAMELQTQAQGTTPFAGSSYDTPPTITAASMDPKTPTQFATTPTYNPNTFAEVKPIAETPVVQQTPLDAQIESMFGELASANTQQVGKSAYKTEQMNALGVSGLKTDASQKATIVNNLAAEINALKVKEQNIKLANEAQYSAQGIAKGIVQGKGRQATYENQIQQNQIAVQGLMATAAYQAAQNNVTAALQSVDDAVAERFDPITEKINVLTSNLDLILKSPQYTAQEKKKAQEQLDIQEAKKAQIADAKQMMKDTKDAVVKAISNNTGLPGFDNLDIAALQAAQTPEEVAAILQARGLSVASQADQLDMEYKQAQIDKMNEETAKIGRTSPITTTSTGQAVVTTQDGKEIPISSEAMNWVNLINNGSISLDEAMTKIGSTAASMKLKNEIIAGINAQGGQTETKLAAMNNTVSSINDILNGDIEYFGASIAPRSVFGFKVNPYYNSFKAKVDNLVASLAIDNLGLLKGPMSDKDIEFIKQMSSGLEIGMDEKSAKERLEKIKTRLEEKIKTASGTSDSQMAEQLTQTATKEQEALRTKYDY